MGGPMQHLLCGPREVLHIHLMETWSKTCQIISSTIQGLFNPNQGKLIIAITLWLSLKDFHSDFCYDYVWNWTELHLVVGQLITVGEVCFLAFTLLLLLFPLSSLGHWAMEHDLSTCWCAQHGELNRSAPPPTFFFIQQETSYTGLEFLKELNLYIVTK